MATATNISIEEMRRFLRESQGWHEVQPSGSKEFVFDWRINQEPHIVLRVYTSIQVQTGVTRPVGSDAIRVCAVDLTNDRGYIRSTRVHRVEGWQSNLQARCKTVLDEARQRLAKAPKPEAKIALNCAAELFDRFGKALAAGLKYPKLRFEVKGHGKVVFARVGSGKNEGAINLTDGKPFGEAQWFGRINPDGSFTKGKAHAAWIDDLLAVMGKDGVLATSVAHGKATSNCCYCSRTLETKESLTVGYGPVCAKKWGLPWGEVDESLFGAKPVTEVDV